jgi:hypothetical protein
MTDGANVTPLRKDNTAALRQRRSRAKLATIPSQEKPNKNVRAAVPWAVWPLASTTVGLIRSHT